MKKLFFFIAILASGLLQTTILNDFRVFTIKPDLLLIFVVIAGLTFELRWVLVFSLFAGIFKDVFCVTFGVNTALFFLWGLLTWRLNREIAIENNLLRALLVFIAAFMHNIASGLIFISSGNILPCGVFLRIVTLQPIYTAAVLPLVFKSVKFVYSTR